MTRTLFGTVAMAVCVALGSGSTASAGGPHNHHGNHGHQGHHGHQHHQHHNHGGYGYGGYRPRYVAPQVVYRPSPVIVAPQQYGGYGPAPCVTDYDYNYGYNGYAPSGVGFTNRNFSLWLGR